MPDFVYKAVRRDGSSAEGTVVAHDRTDAARRLSAKGLQAFHIDNVASGGAAGVTTAEAVPAKDKKSKPKSTPKSKSKSKSRLKAGDRIEPAVVSEVRADKERKRSIGETLFLRPKHIIQFTEELSDLLGAGVQLEPALKMMEGSGDSSVVRQAAIRTRENVRDGMSFARALSITSPSFGELYCNLIAAGEASGALPMILKRQVEYLNTLQELRGRIMTAMIYPAFLFLSGIAVTTLFITFLIPRLVMLIESTGGTVPTVARVIIALSDFLSAYGWMLAIGLAVAVFAFIVMIKAPANRRWWGKTQLSLPFFGSLQQSRFHVQFLETLGAMASNGLELLKSLKLAAGSTSNIYLREQVDVVVDEVADGAPLYRSLERRGVFPTGLVDMVRIGEQTGKLEDALQRSAERFDRELNKKIERITALAQPVIIMIMASVVGVMAYLMITLIYDTITILRER